MKKIIYSAFALLALLAASCTNDDILVETDNNVNEVNLTVSLQNFYQSYDYNDTYHNIKVSNTYRTFNSESKQQIQVQTLIYNSNGELVNELVSYETNVNPVTTNFRLAEGRYTAVTTLVFAKESSKGYTSNWNLEDKDKLSTVKMHCSDNRSMWSIMSYASTKFTVEAGQTLDLNLRPTPVGALGYIFMQNFQYKNEATMGIVADNDIRKLTLYCRNRAVAYRLNPDAVEPYEYLDATGTSSWYFLSDQMEPSDFNAGWVFFETDLYDYFYILAPTSTLCFGYILDGEETFHGYGQGDYSVTSGQVYLAYWDYFRVGNPYFGPADNSHWNRYNSRTRAADLQPEATAYRGPLAN